MYSQLDTENLAPISEKKKKRSCVSMAGECTEGVRRNASMGGNCETVSSRSALRRAGVGEIVEVQGGHIIRATGKKDRHSKVCTAKGPRDRRVRLAAHTAIQFYDVQDRLGYDRPSKAVDWLIKKAKSAIDELDHLPAWSPTSMNMDISTAACRRRGKASAGGKTVESGGSEEQQQQQQQQLYGNVDSSAASAAASLLPSSLDSDAIADTIKSFFPMGGGTSSVSAQMQFPDYRHGGGSGGVRQSQDLRLSLQSFQGHDQILMHSHHQNAATAAHDEQQHSVFGGAAPVGYGNPNVGWADTTHHPPSPDLGRLHRLVADTSMNQHHHHHNGGGGGGGGGVGLSTGGGDASGGFMFNQSPLLQPLFGGHYGQYFTQRGPLQSSNTSSIRAWISDPSIATTSEQQHLQAISVHSQGFSGLGLTSGGFSGFHIPARIQGEEEHDGDLKPSSVSSGSRH
ncbi:hypothetical protein RND81_12G217000 [Saponaria officinalis]|uniref:TCP domain-containing protein n=1 Tax=Saponaria officinalis TaxID=3572 RepID=A0AAW1HDT3_SAPOF